jgi:amidase
MTGFAEYEEYDAVGLARLIRDREVSAHEVLEAAIERIEARNPALNAVVLRLDESARTRAANPLPGPFSGVPFLLKDLGVQVDGVTITNGCRLFADAVGVKDSTLVQRYRSAGLVFAGITSTAEFGLAGETAPELFGPTLNPWDPTRSAGGSSGGAAVAVAAGMVPAVHANDGGGSIRIPSSCCGVFGLKTTRGRNPIGPDVGEGWNGLSTQHVISRTVRDSAALLDVTHGAEPGDPYAAPRFDGSYLGALSGAPRPLRIAMQTVTHTGEPVDPAVVAVVREAATMLESLGHRVDEARPTFDHESLKWNMFTIVGCNAANVIDGKAAALGRSLEPGDVEPITWLWLERCRAMRGTDLARAVTAIHMTARALGRFFESYDILLTPTMPTPPLPLRTIDMRGDDLDAYYDALWSNNTFTTLYNCVGIPAASVPAGWVDGLPVGIQIAAPLGEEMRLLHLAGQLEQAAPWAHRRPPR